ncbi:lipopolysaccharide heptosyltransferase I [Campylobacter sp.]|uniref:lipopolysaccharide heptosyltransferase I n=1 Tax=Campylobacter sp. TaxID=205 RepID=UPI002A62A1A7|nr:lipopolysaccharide heptosyltransferase I [Campylobacter sp.]MDD7703490.1 lipopolysaccharide heptosyltransferase I [Campylobacteraceae bacterium]MDY2635123.1 lipopolysaccharide heptosyltransferase I [Campylobacter sp.]
MKLSALGDIVHASVVVQFIRKHIANAHISWFCDARFEQIARLLAGLDEVVALPLKDKKFLKSFEILRQKQGQFDIIIDLQGLLKSALVSRSLGKNIFGFDRFSAKEGMASIFYTHKYSCNYDKNIILRNLELCAFALNFNFDEKEILTKEPCFLKNSRIPNENSRIPSDNSRIPDKNSRIPNRKILIAPFASESSKCYAHFASVIKGAKEFAQCFLIAGSEIERKKATKLASSGATLLAPLDLAQILEFMDTCDLIIGNDSGITHLAWAQNCATITLFGNRSGARNAFATPKNLIIQATPKHEIDAFHIDKSDFCINDIDPAQIIAKAKGLCDA